MYYPKMVGLERLELILIKININQLKINLIKSVIYDFEFRLI